MEFIKDKETILYECIEDLARELDRIMWTLSEDEKKKISDLLLTTMLKSGKYIFTNNLDN